MLRTLVVILITITLLVPVASVAGQDKAKTDTQTKTDTKPVSGSDAAKGKNDPAAKGKEEDKEKVEEAAGLLRQRGIFLLRQAGDEAADIKDQQIAALTVAKTADVLWPYDRDNARRLFEKAFDIALTYYRDNKQVDTPPTPGARIKRNDTRMEIINLVGRRDSVLARKYAALYVEARKKEALDQATSKINEREVPYMGRVAPLSAELITIARFIYATDPKLSIEMAQQSISLGISSGVASYVSELADKDRATADKLYLFALDRIANDNTIPPGQLLLLSAYPFGESNILIITGSGSSSGYGFSAPKNFTVDPQLVQRFLAVSVMVLSRVFDSIDPQSPDTLSVAAVALYGARMLQPKVETYQPSMMDQWEAMTSRLSGMATVDARLNIQSGLKEIEDRKNGGPSSVPPDRSSDLLDKAEKTKDPAKKDEAYRQAAFEIFRTGDIDRALAIIDKISDPDYRAKSKSWLCFDAAQKATEEKRFDDARRWALRVDETDQSAFLFVAMAKAAVKDKDRVLATQLLDEAQSRASAADNSAGKVNALLGIASLYSTIDPLRAFEAIAGAVSAANKVPDFGIDQNYLKREVRSPGRSGMTSVSSVADFDFGKSLAVLAKTDFDRSLLLAQTLDGKALRITTVISIAQSVIDNKIK